MKQWIHWVHPTQMFKNSVLHHNLFVHMCLKFIKTNEFIKTNSAVINFEGCQYSNYTHHVIKNIHEVHKQTQPQLISKAAKKY